METLEFSISKKWISTKILLKNVYKDSFIGLKNDRKPDTKDI